MSSVAIQKIENRILLIRGLRVMVDADLAELYQVETKVLLQAIKGNPERFPADFMFQLNYQEVRNLRSQFVTSSLWGGRRYFNIGPICPIGLIDKASSLVSKTD